MQDMLANDVVEPSRVVEQALLSATETSIMILRIDDVISASTSAMGGEEDFGDM